MEKLSSVLSTLNKKWKNLATQNLVLSPEDVNALTTALKTVVGGEGAANAPGGRGGNNPGADLKRKRVIEEIETLETLATTNNANGKKMKKVRFV
jgi:hypothetical protein